MPARQKIQRMLQIVSVLTIAFFAVTDLPWTLDDYDQAKQAFISYQMVEEGRWLYQTTPDEGLPALHGRHTSHHISSKPPGIGWISAGLYSITRSWDFAWRFPSFAAAIVLGFLIWHFARMLFGEFSALVALAAFGLNILSVRLATLVRTDMPLALVTSAIGLIILGKIHTRSAWTKRDQLVLFAILTAAMFVKGPIVYAFILPALVVYELRRRSGRDRDSPSAWSGWWPWITSLALFLVWVVAGVRWIDGFFEDVVLTEFAGRFREGVHRSQPFWFYLPHLLQKFAPWSLLMLGLCLLGFRRRKTARQRWELSPETLWMMAWALGGIIVMSLIPSKRVDRIFPAIPPLCLLLGSQVRIAWQSQTNSLRIRWITTCAIILGASYTAGYAAFRLIDGYRNDRAALKRFGEDVRRIAAAEHLHYDVIAGRDESLLLYLRRLRFHTLEEETEGAIRESKPLVVPLDEEPWRSLKIPMRLMVEKKGEHRSSYGFMVPLADR